MRDEPVLVGTKLFTAIKQNISLVLYMQHLSKIHEMKTFKYVSLRELHPQPYHMAAELYSKKQKDIRYISRIGYISETFYSEINCHLMLCTFQTKCLPGLRRCMFFTISERCRQRKQTGEICISTDCGVGVVPSHVGRLNKSR